MSTARALIRRIWHGRHRAWSIGRRPSARRPHVFLSASSPISRTRRWAIGLGWAFADQYSPVRMEAAAERALLTGACRYQSVKSILKNSLDALPPTAPPTTSPPAPHDNIRGAGYFE